MASNNSKITLEEKDQLKFFAGSDSYKVVIKLLNLLTESQIGAVMQVDLNLKTDRDLAFAKARSEGAIKITRDFHEFVARLTKGAKSESDSE